MDTLYALSRLTTGKVDTGASFEAMHLERMQTYDYTCYYCFIIVFSTAAS